MGIGGYILAGALQGAGNAITTQATQAADARRAMALENLRSSNARETAMFTAKLDDAKDASKQARSNEYAIKLTGVRTDAQKEVDTNRGTIVAQNDAASDARDRQTRIVIEGLQHKYRMSEDEAKDVRQFMQENSQVSDIKVLASGQIVGLTKGGDSIAYKGNAGGRQVFLRTAKPGESGGDSGGATVGAAMAGRGQSSGAAPAASPTAAPRGIGQKATGSSAPAAQSSGGAAQERPNGGYSAEENAALMTKLGTPDYFADAAASMDRPKTYTVADLRELAQKTGMTEAEARAWARDNGFAITR